MNETVSSAILVIISCVVVVTNLVVFTSFKRKLKKIEESIHQLKPRTPAPGA